MDKIKEYNKLYRYCTRTKVHGAVYKERLKRLKNITTIFLRQENIGRFKK